MARTRSVWHGKLTLAAVGLCAAVLALTGYAMFTGDDEGEAPAAGKGGPKASASASASPSYSVPDNWTEPALWAALPRGQRTDDRGSQVGFPHTPEGAVAMLMAATASSVEGDQSSVDQQLRSYYSYLVKAEQTGSTERNIKQNGQNIDKEVASGAGAAPGQPLPSGVYMRSHVVGFKIIKESPDEVNVWLLARAVHKYGETAKESGSYTRAVAGAVWQDGDWKLSGKATDRAAREARSQPKPEMVAPGDAAFNTSGWTAIREAS
ncbi:hypothetical protein [Streptomyces sp. NPDC058745]|uniref:hypothetical protein n=1 Tax=Streptomyces sp. NPDC058745 TaxID=3346621 RepID=UPI003678DB67